MNNSTKLLSDLTVFNKYARYNAQEGRRETYAEICDRYENMMVKKYPQLRDKIVENMHYIRDKKVLPSMRAFQFAGKAMESNNSRGYNCSFLPIDNLTAFSEIMFLLLSGCGVGFSVQKHHIDKLPEIDKDSGTMIWNLTYGSIDYKNNKHREPYAYTIVDSIEGWADAIKEIFGQYFGVSPIRKFDYSQIREKGSRIVTSGGKAPGFEPLKNCIDKLRKILESKNNGEKLRPIEAHDIACIISDAVLAGGIRRSALISLFSKDDTEMLESKKGAWWEHAPHRGRANNSAVLHREHTTKDEYLAVWKKIEESGAGEPAVYWTNDLELGTNPCCEISLKPMSFCNLTEINAEGITSQQDFDRRAEVASFFGTLQAGFMDFHYLRPEWRQVAKEEALIGVGITGIASGTLKELDLSKAADIVKHENKLVSGLIGIAPAARCTTVKPSGTTSCVLSTSSGIHSWHSEYYIRRSQITKDNILYNYFLQSNPSVIQDYRAIPNSAVIELPQKAPKGSTTRLNESTFDMLDRVFRFNVEWVKEGHNRGSNTNNVSATVSIKEDEWEEVGEYLWDKRHQYNGMATLPYDGGTYEQAPFETITKEEYERRVALIKPFDFIDIKEEEDITEVKQEIACAGGACDLTFN